MRAVFWPAIAAIGGTTWLAGLLCGIALVELEAPQYFGWLGIAAGVLAIVGGCLRMALASLR